MCVCVYVRVIINNQLKLNDTFYILLVDILNVPKGKKKK